MEGGGETIADKRTNKMSVDRRDFLRLLTSAAALVATECEVVEGQDRTATLPDRRVDVVVVGAGLAGLTAVFLSAAPATETRISRTATLWASLGMNSPLGSGRGIAAP